MAKIKEAGRPPGAPNKKSIYVRDEDLKIRASEGLNKTITALIASGEYKSKADVIHDAVQHLAYRKLSKKTDLYWMKRIM
jgi:Arc/MetJ-type ribon-helix-helix transcriptional regulator